MSDKIYSRRGFLRGASAVLGMAIGSAAIGCAPKVVTETVVVEKEVEKIVEKVVEKAAPERKKIRVLMSAWMRAISPVDRATADYNQEHGDTEFIIEDAAGGEWRTKLVAQVRAGNPVWSGHLGDSSQVLAEVVRTEIAVPIDDMLAASSEPAAQAVNEQFLELPRKLCTYEDRLYGVSWRLDVVACTYNKKFAEAVGMEEFPKTWQGIEELAGNIRKEFKDQGVWGMQHGRHLFYGANAIFYTMVDQPWRDDGVFDILNPKFIESLEMLKKWQDNDLTPAPPWQDQGGAHMTLFEAGKAGLVVTPHIWGKWAAMVQGTDVISDPVTMPPTGARTPAWAFPTLIYKNAPHASETFDYLMYVQGPLNDAMMKSSIDGRGMSCYKRGYSEVLPKSPTQAWQADLFEFIQDATPMIHTTTFSLQNDKMMAKQEDYLLGKYPTAKAAMEAAMTEVEAEIAKQQVK